MDRLEEKIIKNLENEYLKILYSKSFNLTKRTKDLRKEVFDSWKAFLLENKIYIIFDKSQEENKFITGEEFLLDLINRKQDLIKDKIILNISLDTTYFLEDYETYSAPYPDLRKDTTLFYAITDMKN